MPWFYARNGYSSHVTIHKKKVLYYRKHSFLGATENLNILKDPNDETFIDGWFEDDNYVYVNNKGRESVKFLKLCQIIY